MIGKSGILLLPVLFVTLTGFAIAIPSATRAAEPYSRTDNNRNNLAPSPHDLVQGAHVEGHIAFLHAELGITPAQEALWAPVAAAMREDVRNIQEAEDKMARQTQGPATAVQYLDERVLFANLRAQGEARFIKAFRPLYDNLSGQQRQVADELLVPAMPE